MYTGYFLMTRPKLYILCGLPFAGKTYVANAIKRNFDVCVVNFDELFKLQEKGIKGKTERKQHQWELVKKEALKLLRKNLLEGKNVIWDSTNPLKEYRDELKKIAGEYNAIFNLIYVKTPINIIFKRVKYNEMYAIRHKVDPDDLSKTIKEFDVVKLTHDIKNLKSGDKGVVVDVYKNAYEVEFFNDAGETIDVLTLTDKEIKSQ